MSPIYFTLVTLVFALIGGTLTVLGHSTEGMMMLSAAAGSFALECKLRAAAAEKKSIQAEKRTVIAERTAQEALESTQTLRRDLLEAEGRKRGQADTSSGS